VRITWNGDMANARVKSSGAHALKDAVEFLLEESNRTVPLEEGTLERSGTTSVDEDELRGAVSYGGPYARRQHEELNYRHPGGRRAKWLERTFQEQQGRVLQYLARVGRAFG
jgi:hypothetical protein